MAVNEKKLLEKFTTIRAALNVLLKECAEAERELSDIPVRASKKKKGLSEEEKIRIRARINKNRQHFTFQ